MVNLRLLSEEERFPLFEIYDREFDAELPHEDQAHIIACYDENGEIEAFVTAEILIRADMWWVREDVRDTPRSASLIRRMARFILGKVPRGSSIITLAGCDTHRRIFERLGMRLVQGDVYRIDIER